MDQQDERPQQQYQPQQTQYQAPPQHPVPYPQHQNQHQNQQQHQQMQPYQPQPYPQPQQWQGAPVAYPGLQPAVKAKNPGLAAVLSFFWPGVGQILNGSIGLGITMMVLVVLAWISLLIVVGFILLPAIYIWSVVEAYSTAKRWNQSHGIIS